MNQLLFNSIESKQKLKMIYLSEDNQISQRIIGVLKIKGDTVLAYCYSRRKVRSFKFGNILSVVPVGKCIGA
ncbi:hypothetical protein [Virgibacillus ndiopensis]|uniref:hypothetical protein n=1 Tax=Virgibacillus ndiopensis TaxID=2004408 RepID=UPI000C0727A7|nr:hypothetical protein [Virgibacillus ndiopensis]